MKRITIKDVAQRAGVSSAAVSYVLNGREHKVSADTLSKIKKAIAELNYIPDYSARSLANNKSNLIGVVIPQTEDQSQLLLENPFYCELICGIEAKLRQSGYHMILSGVNKGEGYLDVSMQRNLDGAIIMGIYQESFYEDLKKVNIPIVLIDSYINDNYFKRIGIDDELGGYMATTHLIENGHQNIALVTGTIRKDGVVEKRFLGYKRSLKEHGLFYNPDYVFEGSVSYDHGVESGRAIASDRRGITAVFATGDLVAFGVIAGLSENGVKVPEDISVIGFDDISLSKMFVPRLTTVRQDIVTRGSAAAQCLIDSIEGKEDVETELTLPIELVVRDTVKRI
ncbi:LacI family DNA-binding transcriptional regulator [Paenibacillus thermoaerophilus]|uniref:LacI family DNA-binding transcriptional regulator n=1 Tax=Paenibacillus thermoaerophilus TaxID=1215385 RepID=A0ABW2UX81_9BACL|nr:LacI family DNA-binding transcriptional regulator [Paenibacillus thermoaerophilus]TMV17371.1 LacI family transcriptional regulator [Paenibacillus thermoaerophilus]